MFRVQPGRLAVVDIYKSISSALLMQQISLLILVEACIGLRKQIIILMVKLSHSSFNICLFWVKVEILVVKLNHVWSLSIIIWPGKNAPVPLLWRNGSNLNSMLFLELGPGELGVH